MWILDCAPSGRGIDLWIKKENGKVVRRSFRFENYFFLHFPDRALHVELLEALETRYKVEECTFKTIYGEIEGYRIYAGRKVAEMIERQAKDAKLFNVDVRLEQKFMARKRIFPCSHVLEDVSERFEADFDLPFEVLRVGVKGDVFKPEVEEMSINGKRIEGSEKELLEELSGAMEDMNPDIVVMEDADFWMQHLGLKAMSRTGRFRKLSQKVYWSYGRARYRKQALIPEGRVLIDSNSFNFREGGLRGVLLASRISAVSPNHASRITPGSLISLYEVFEALMRGIAVPFRKSDAERVKSIEELRFSDRGGMIFQPEPGIYENVWQLDFTSMYPSIIVKHNLSPESIGKEGRGFLAEVLEPLLRLRIKTKSLKRKDSRYVGVDSILKWMLVTCFGYTGYRNAKFGRIEVHEEINRIGREILIKTKEIAEELGFKVLHGIVDCLWVRGEDIGSFQARVEEETGLLTEVEKFDWIVFLPMKDGSGAYNRYYGRLSSGEMKLRGVMARRRDVPEYVKRMQRECFDVMKRARSAGELLRLFPELRRIYERYAENIRRARPEEMIIRKVVGKAEYGKKLLESSAIREYRKAGIEIKPGMVVEYVVADSKRKVVSVRNHSYFDVRYYRKLLDKAWEELSWFLKSSHQEFD